MNAAQAHEAHDIASENHEEELDMSARMRTAQRTARALTVTGMLMASLTLGSVATAVAQPTSENLGAEKAVLVKVVSAPDHKAAYASLSAPEKALFAKALRHQKVTEVKHTHRMSSAEVSAAVASGELAAKPAFAAMSSGGGCWSAYAYDTWSNLTVKEGNTWFTLNWCSDGTRVTTFDYRNVGAQGLNTFQFTGIENNIEHNFDWEAREAIEYRFSFEGKRFYVCSQLRGGATGLYSHRQDCNIWAD